MSGKIEVNYDLPPSSQTLAGMYCTQECTGMYCTQARDGFFHHSKLEQSSSSSFNGSNGRWSVLLLENNNGDHLILRLTSLAKLKKICMQFARKMHPRISDAKLGNNPKRILLQCREGRWGGGMKWSCTVRYWHALSHVRPENSLEMTLVFYVSEVMRKVTR